MTSKLTKLQVLKFYKEVVDNNENSDMWVTIRYDNGCNNGHNTFSIIGCIESIATNNIRSGWRIRGHIASHFPEFAHLLKWHGMTTDGPIHHTHNIKYWAEQNDIEMARFFAMWPDATIGQLLDKEQLLARLPTLMAEFKKDIEALGFIY